MKKRSLTLLILPILLLLSSPVKAVTSCQGNICSQIPAQYMNELDNFNYIFQNTYLKPVLQSMTEASAMTNIASPLIGKGYVNKFQIGVGGAGGFIQKNDISISYKGINLPDMPNVGAAGSPEVMIGVNLGWLLRHGPYEKRMDDMEDEDDDDDKPEAEKVDKHPRTLWHKFNIYIHGMKYGLNSAKVAKGSGIGGVMGITSGGLTIRYNLFDPIMYPYDMVGFHGVSFGLGYHVLKQDSNLSYQEPNSTGNPIQFGNYNATWSGTTQMHYRSTVSSIPLEVRTGVKLLYLFDIFVGAGISKNSGWSNLDINKNGPLTATVSTTNLPAGYSIPPAIAALLPNTVTASGNLLLTSNGSGSISNSMKYGIVGLELNIWVVKFVAEAFIFEKAYSGNAGVKVSF